MNITKNVCRSYSWREFLRVIAVIFVWFCSIFTGLSHRGIQLPSTAFLESAETVKFCNSDHYQEPKCQESWRKSQSCATDFAHVDSPSAVLRMRAFILYTIVASMQCAWVHELSFSKISAIRGPRTQIGSGCYWLRYNVALGWTPGKRKRSRTKSTCQRIVTAELSG